MSVRVMTWVFEHSKSTGNDRLVLLAIADRANDEGTDAWPSIETLAGKTRASESTVKRSIRRLVELGELDVIEVGTGRRSSRYRVAVEGGQIDTPSEGGQFDRGVTREPPGGSRVTPDTSLRPKTPQPPASGGRDADSEQTKLNHCGRHVKHRASCPDCVARLTASRAKPKWCGECNETTRLLEDPVTAMPLGRCPFCHPLGAPADEHIHTRRTA